MGSDQNLIKAAVVLTLTVIGTLLYGAFNTVVCIAVHGCFSPFSKFPLQYGQKFKKKSENYLPNIEFIREMWYVEEENRT